MKKFSLTSGVRWWVETSWTFFSHCHPCTHINYMKISDERRLDDDERLFIRRSNGQRREILISFSHALPRWRVHVRKQGKARKIEEQQELEISIKPFSGAEEIVLLFLKRTYIDDVKETRG